MWTDGSDWDYTDWGAGEPNDHNGEDCMELALKIHFNDDLCTDVKAFVCKI